LGPQRVGAFSSRTFKDRRVTFSRIDGLAVFEGDIVLGDVNELERALEELEEGSPTEGIAIKRDHFRWPDAVVVFRIDAVLPNPERVRQAIGHWEANTPVRFRERTSESDFVTFVPGDGCSSSVGRRGGEQFITLGPGCTAGNAIHEIGHTVGLWHEQSRADRDQFVTVVVENIIPEALHNFDQHVRDGEDLGGYDYGSIMHYPANAFAIDPDRPTLVTRHGELIGQRVGLSGGDIAAVRAIYPSARPER
jgi:hypothetical protein